MAQALKVPETKKKSPVAKKSPAEVVVERRRAAIKRTRGVLVRLAPRRSLVKETIAERRAEAQAEDHEDAAEAARRRRRACLALAARLGVPALTADSIWTQAETSAEVKLIR